MPSSTQGSLLQSWRSLRANIYAYRFFIRQLIRISILADFRRSFIGILWLFIMPILSVIVWILLNGAGIIEPGEVGIPYPAYVLLSTSIWGFFFEMYKSASTVITGHGKMMIMTKFPHEVLIIQRIIVHLIRFVIPFAVNIVVLLFFGVRFTWLSLLFPITLLPLLLLGVAIGLVVALLRVVAVDISNLIDEGMRFLMFLTPIIYTPKIELGWLSDIIYLNPLTYLIGFSRDVLTQGTFYEPQSYLLCSGVTLVVLIIGIRVFLLAEPKVLERLINV
ncbi:MAG: ABC transporter permease [Bacteroidota bacterium]